MTTAAYRFVCTTAAFRGPFRVVAREGRIRIVPGDYPRLGWLCEVNPYQLAPAPAALGAMIATRLNWQETLIARAQIVVDELRAFAVPVRQREALRELESLLKRVSVSNAGEAAP